MNDKELLLQAFKANQGKMDEITLGEQLGLSETETQRIISQLLSEHKIEFEQFGLCNYKTK
ncbi:hypothetical protein Palpr_2589 [Paludibacter propionicigenes WB4]|uniref:MarR family transcriptional regulator n=1 Tax=Paludibacter propionicigenes (strain DSM 17365 / JCM 13257 / WB4) TaxID=694427 RepID=E4T7M7_PALPW|nr:hypothetical protein [Paludibacter propionicigenes]ADQ80721.1 hypothetical protein Palpr_2589 [Paludibacter propionicigenes WB4]